MTTEQKVSEQIAEMEVGTTSREDLRKCLLEIQEFLRSRDALSNSERLLLLNMVNAHLL